MTSPKSNILQSVSRETEDRLNLYAQLVRRWSPKINLVSKSTLATLENRHMSDSAQLLVYANLRNAKTWVDLGSGGGFPGLVIAILARELHPELSVTLVESDKRKATFLRTVSRETGIATTVIADRIETVPPLNSDILSARALAPLSELLGLAHRHMLPDSTALLPKGQGWQAEIDTARQHWDFTCQPHESITNPDSVILEIREVSHV